MPVTSLGETPLEVAEIEWFLHDPATPSAVRARLSQPAKIACMMHGGEWMTLPFIGDEVFELTGTRVTPTGKAVVMLYPNTEATRTYDVSRAEIPIEKLGELFPDLLARIAAHSAATDDRTIKEGRDAIASPCAAETDSRFGSW